MAGATVKVNW